MQGNAEHRMTKPPDPIGSARYRPGGIEVRSPPFADDPTLNVPGAQLVLAGWADALLEGAWGVEVMTGTAITVGRGVVVVVREGFSALIASRIAGNAAKAQRPAMNRAISFHDGLRTRA